MRKIEMTIHKAIKTRDDLSRVLNNVPYKNKAHRNKIVCSIIGHSKIQKACFGYFYCGRCDELLGDSLGGVYSAKDVVIIGHNCKVCRENYEKLIWKDKIYTPYPLNK